MEEEAVPLVEVDVGLLADQVGVSATNTLDLGQGVHDLLLSVNIGVEKTEDELEVRLFAGYERYITVIAIPSVFISVIILSIFIKPASSNRQLRASCCDC